VYFNVDHVRDTITSLVKSAADRPKLVVLDLSAAPYVDIQSAHALGELADELAAMGMQVQAVEARAVVRDRLRHEGVDAKLGDLARRDSVFEVVAEHQIAANSTSGPQITTN